METMGRNDHQPRHYDGYSTIPSADGVHAGTGPVQLESVQARNPLALNRSSKGPGARLLVCCDSGSRTDSFRGNGERTRICWTTRGRIYRYARPITRARRRHLDRLYPTFGVAATHDVSPRRAFVPAFLIILLEYWVLLARSFRTRVDSRLTC